METAIGSVRTLRDEIQEVMNRRGIDEAVGFEVTTKQGEQFTILSEDNPRMDMPAGDVANVVIKQSARAGSGLGKTLVRFRITDKGLVIRPATYLD